jgi:hypothetical protein
VLPKKEKTKSKKKTKPFNFKHSRGMGYTDPNLKTNKQTNKKIK